MFWQMEICEEIRLEETFGSIYWIHSVFSANIYSFYVLILYQAQELQQLKKKKDKVPEFIEFVF